MPDELEPSDSIGTDYPRSPCCGQVIMGTIEDGWACLHCGQQYTLYYESDT